MGVAAFVVPVFTMVVAGFPPLAPDLGAATAPAAAPTAKAAAGTGLGAAEGTFAGRAGAAGRLGLTVMRAVSLGGADLTTAVPVFALGSGGGATGVAVAGFRGATPGAGGTAAPGVTGLTGKTAPGATGLTGLTGAAAAGLAGAAGDVGMTGGGGPALGVPTGVGGGGVSMACVLLGTTADSGFAAGVSGFTAGEAGTTEGSVTMGVVEGEMRGGGATTLDFFFVRSASLTVSAMAPAATAATTAGMIFDGLGGTGIAGFGVSSSLVAVGLRVETAGGSLGASSILAVTGGGTTTGLAIGATGEIGVGAGRFAWAIGVGAGVAAFATETGPVVLSVEVGTMGIGPVRRLSSEEGSGEV